MAVEIIYEDYIDILIRWADKYDVVDFPRDRESLTSIKELTISNLDLYSIPVEIFYLKQLEELRFFHTTMASIPKELKLLVNLKRLGIYYHDLILELPSEIGELTSLEELVIYDCSLKKLPKEIGSLDKLQKFELTREYSIESLPPEFGNLKGLKELIITNTKIEVFPQEFEHLEKLTSVRIERNQIKEFPSFLLKNKNLEELTLSEDKITNIPNSIAKLKVLKKLFLSCSLDFLPNEICYLPSLRILYAWNYNSTLKQLPKDFVKIACRGILTINGKEVSYDENSIKQQKQLLKKIWLHIFESDGCLIDENKEEIIEKNQLDSMEVPEIERSEECELFLEYKKEKYNKRYKQQISEDESEYSKIWIEWAHDN